MGRSEEEEAFERYQAVLRIVEENAGGKKTKLMQMVQELVDKCADYVRAVNRMVLFQQMNRYRHWIIRQG